MTRVRTVHRCTACGAVAAQWAGRCPACGDWNSLMESVDDADQARRARLAPAALAAMSADRSPVLLGDVPVTGAAPIPTGLAELDRVLAGGLLPGSVTLLGGEPGIGKSTLLLQMVARLAGRGARCLVISAEESPAQVRGRAERMGCGGLDDRDGLGVSGGLGGGVWLADLPSLPAIQAAVAQIVPDVMVVDSIQMVFDPDVDSPPGSMAQVRGCAQVLAAAAKAGGPATVLVGHVTKDGALAGPRVLEHLVDTVLSFEGDRHHALRLLRAVKHRFGGTGELGLFEMGEGGLESVADASGMFLADRRAG